MSRYRAALSHLYAALPFDFWFRVTCCPRSELSARPRCTCYVLPHADDCGLFLGITQSGERVFLADAADDDDAAFSR